MIDRNLEPPALKDDRPLRIGAVTYLNSKPLIYGFDSIVPDVSLILDFPSRLADQLCENLLDVALIPSVEALRNPHYEIVSDACVAARGPVLSVKLYSRTELGRIRRLALDEGSRTSAALSQVILAHRYGVRPALESLPLGCCVTESTADAILLIGDRAMFHPAEDFPFELDLGQIWNEWTGLPFVFALWVKRAGVDLGTLESALCHARDLGVLHAEEIALAEAPHLGLKPSLAIDYLTKHLHFQLSSAEICGLKLFNQLASELGLTPHDTGSLFTHRSVARAGSCR